MTVDIRIGIIIAAIAFFLMFICIKSYLKELMMGRHYRTTKGIVIKSISSNSKEYEEKKLAKDYKKHPKAKKIADKLGELFPSMKVKNTAEEAVYSSLIQYEVMGKKYEIVSGFGADVKETKKKEYIIKYDPKDPNEAFIKNDRGKFAWIIIVMILLITAYFFIF